MATHFRAVETFRNLFPNCAERQLVLECSEFAVRSGHRMAKRTILNKSSGDPMVLSLMASDRPFPKHRPHPCAAGVPQTGQNNSGDRWTLEWPVRERIHPALQSRP